MHPDPVARQVSRQEGPCCYKSTGILPHFPLINAGETAGNVRGEP
jgi:hypothetical protein